MTYNEFRDKLCSIDISKNCFKFLAERIASNGYRGIQCSQHNRYDMDIIDTILTELYNIAGTDKIVIRTTDLSKRPGNYPDEADYAVYVDALSRKLGRCTQDSVRKNLFVDIHRMGLIERFNSKGIGVGAYDNGIKKYVRISKQGLDFIDAGLTMIDKQLRYTRAIDTLTHGLADQLLVITDLDCYITENEFQFFFSFCGKSLGGHRYTVPELVDYIKEFRRLSRFQQEHAIKLVKEYCDPKSFKGDKTEKRDFHNWLNETQQIFMLMSQTAYYELDKDMLRIRIGKGSLYDSKEKLMRSSVEKAEYFKQHSVAKTKGYELHHIVPLCWAKSPVEFAALDVWKNLIYVDGYKHSVITQNNNEHVKLSFDGDDIIFSTVTGEELECQKGVNVLYDSSKQGIMKSYNQDLLDSCGA